jgi:hypothetical protein
VSEELEALLRLVADGRLTPAEAAPIVAALTGRAGTQAPLPAPGALAKTLGGENVPARVLPAGPRQLRIRVEEHGRTVVNLRVPLAVAETALNMVPGLAGEQAARVRAALEGGTIGPIIDVEDPDGDAVLISLE